MTKAASISTTTATAASPPSPKEAPKPPTPPEPEKPIAPEWTEAQDAILIDMKQQGKTWKEIEAALPGKERDLLKERFRQLNAEKLKEKGEAPKGEAPKEEEKKKDESSNENESKDEKGKSEAKAEDAKVTEKKSNLKESKGKKVDDVLKKIGDRPIIYIDSGDQLDAEQV